MFYGTIRILLAVSVLLGCQALAASPEEARLWALDLDFLTSRVRLLHPSAADSNEKQAFERNVSELRQRLDSVSSHQFAVQIAHLTATLNDAHSRLLLNSVQPAFKRLPIEVGIFSDGVYVISATDELQGLRGKRIVGIGALGMEDVLTRMKPFISFENEMWFLQAAPQRLVLPDFLAAAGVVASTESVPLRILDGSAEREVMLRTAKPDGLKLLKASAPRRQVPLREKHADLKYWFSAVPNTKALYVQYRQVADDKPETIAEFARRLKTEFDGRGYERLILDLRSNGGGNNLLNRPLLQSLIRIPILTETGRLIVLTGRSTFSAAVMLALDLERHFNPVFVGEPPGNSPSFSAEPVTLTLPNSKLRVFLSTVAWHYGDPRDHRNILPPLVSVAPSWADESQGSDTALERAVAWVPEIGLADCLQAALDAGGEAHFRESLASFRAEPTHQWFDTEGPLTRLGYKLLRANRSKESVLVFEVNARLHPDSATALTNLAEAVLRSGDRERSIQIYRQALVLDPRNVRAIESLTALGQMTESNSPR